MSFLDRFRRSKSIDAPASYPGTWSGLTPGDVTHPDLDVGPEVIDFLYRSMQIDAEWSIREPRAFTWWGHRLAQRVWAEPVRHSDGYAVVRIVAETNLLRGVPNTRSVAAGLAGFNHHASMSAFVWDPQEASINLRCVAYAHPETADTVKLLFVAACGLQASDAHIKVDRLVPLLGGEPALSNHPTSGPRPLMDDIVSVIEQLFAPAGTGPAPFSKRDFSAAARSKYIPWAKVHPKGMTVHGMLRSQDRPSGTGILTMSAESRHPQLGSGLLNVLAVPLDLKPDLLLGLSHELNHAEATTFVRPHFFGGWCPDPDPAGGLAFASFIPTTACKPGLIEAIAVSMAARAAWSTRLIDAARIELPGSAAGEGPQNVMTGAIGRALAWEATAARDRLRQFFGTSEAPPAEGDSAK